MPESRHEGGPGLIANRFKPIRPLRPNVLHARDGRRHVAIEMVPAADHDLVELRRRIAAANAIDHPNLCRPREVVEHGDLLVLVTELVEGVSIGDRLMVGPFDPLQVGALLVELLSVLARIHAEGLAHGSISPSTVTIDANGALRLMDLGILRTAHTPTPRGDLEATGTLAKTMLAGYQGSIPAQLMTWISRCGDHARPFADVRAAAAALVTPDVVSTEVRGRTPTLVGMSSSKRLPVRERPESSVAIKIPTIDEPNAKPLEVVTVEPLRRARAPSAMVRTSEALALAASLQEGDATTAVPVPLATVAAEPEVAAKPAVKSAPEAAPETVAAPDAKAADEAPDASVEHAKAAPARAPSATATTAAKPRRARGPLIAGGLAAAAALALVGWWANTGKAESEPAKPSVVWVSEPLPSPPVPRGKPPLPTGAVVVPVDQVPVTIRLDEPTRGAPARPTPPAGRTTPAAPTMAVARSTESPVEPAATLDVAFSPESAWIETPAVYVLEDAYRRLVRAPTTRVEVIGHSSNDGEELRNTQLAIGRAIAVKRFLVDRGVEEGRIAIVAKPNEAPTAADDRDARARTRRAEIRILPPTP